ncbi:hypothetical protein OAA53_00175 [Salibacteraceae bacterium]|nr:hypothetical protein [Flavobacteriales bacterium]MDB9701125.1 hypothetical protein [Salibacteraceae bacterium]
MKLLLSILVLCTALTSYAQDSTVVRFFVKGGEKYRVKIDDKLQPETNIFTVEKGEHKVEIWSFKNDVFLGTMQTGNLDSTNYFAELRKTGDYLGYLSQRDDYKRKLFFARTAPYLITGVSVIALPFLYSSRNNKHEELVQNQFYYERGQIQSQTLQNVQNQYTSRNILFYTASAGCVIGVASFFLLKPYAEKLTPPVFKQRNPFTLEEMELSMNPQIQRPEVGLTFTF